MIQGRRVGAEDLALIRDLIARKAAPHRSGLSQLLCQLWSWRTPTGRPKDMAARSLLRKLAQRGFIELPAPRRRQCAGSSRPRAGGPASARAAVPDGLACDPLLAPLAQIQPLRLQRVDTAGQRSQAFAVLRAHHYLGFSRSVGENLGYLFFDAMDRLLGVTWFGAPAWKAAARDRFIGWSPAQREKNLGYLANQVRFLILPWVRVPHLASHVLGLLARRLSRDWQLKYGHPVVLLETFIEEARFQGASYRAANWIVVGRTQGRSRQDRARLLVVPTKQIAVLPLHRDWRRTLQPNPTP